MPSRIDPATGKVRRGVSNGNERGGSESRRRRKVWLLETYAANRQLIRVEWNSGEVTIEDYAVAADLLLEGKEIFGLHSVELVPTCRCYRCGVLLWFGTMTVDRIHPGWKKTKKWPKGGTYVRTNIRPACLSCNSETGGGMANNGAIKKGQKVTGRRGHRPALVIVDETAEFMVASSG